MKFSSTTLISLFLLCRQVTSNDVADALRTNDVGSSRRPGRRGLWWFFGPDDDEKFTIEVKATGDQEVPPVSTSTEATLELEFDEGFTEVEFDLDVEDGALITQAHLHCGLAGENGGVLLFLYNTAPIGGPGGMDVDGSLASGVLTSADLTGAACDGVDIVTLASLYEAILSRRVYLNVHSEGSPSGIVRGQLFP